MTDVEVRELEPHERDAVKTLHGRCFSDGMALDELVLDSLFTHPYGITLLATLDGEIVGFAGAIHGARPKARLLTIHVDPELRRFGVATALLDALEARLVARKARILELEVHADNEAAQRLYEARGFEIVREDPNAYPSVDPSDGYVMAKPLDQAPEEDPPPGVFA